jgi:hypothetical protein
VKKEEFVSSSRWISLIIVTLIIYLIFSLGQTYDIISKDEGSEYLLGLGLLTCALLIALFGVLKRKRWARLLAGLLFFYWSISRLVYLYLASDHTLIYWIFRDGDIIEFVVWSGLLALLVFVIAEGFWLLFSSKAKTCFTE